MAENTSKEFVDIVVNVRRVTKVTKGGKRFSFSALVVTGDQQGRVGFALGKGNEVRQAIDKAIVRGRKKMFELPLRNTTLPYEVQGKYGATRVVLRPAYKGTGVIAGGAVRAVMMAVGVKDVLGKIVFGSRNPQNVLKATLNALAHARSAAHLAQLRGQSVRDLVGGKHVSAA